jgi:hypothetical protein
MWWYKFKYQIYLDHYSPFIHGNISHLYQGEFYLCFSGYYVMDAIADDRGQTVVDDVTFPINITIHLQMLIKWAFSISKGECLTKPRFVILTILFIMEHISLATVYGL